MAPAGGGLPTKWAVKGRKTVAAPLMVAIVAVSVVKSQSEALSPGLSNPPPGELTIVAVIVSNKEVLVARKFKDQLPVITGGPVCSITRVARAVVAKPSVNAPPTIPAAKRLKIVAFILIPSVLE